MLCRIEKLVHGGNGLARTVEGKRVFVEDALPGELVKVSLFEEKQGWATATVDELIEANEHRRLPACPYYGVCGGCDFQYAEDGYQALLNEQIVLDNLVRLGGVDLQSCTVEPVVTGQAWNYRNRVRFHVDLYAKQVGFLARKSNTLVPIDSCPVLVDALQALLTEPEPLFAAARRLMFANKGGKGRYIEVPVFASDDGLSVLDQEVMTTVGGKRFFLSSEVFFQSNRFLVSALAEYVASKALGSVVMDLYSGVGTFSAFLEQAGRKVIAVEKQKLCLSFAKRNVPFCSYYAEAVEIWAKGRKEQVDTVVVDPPRTGLDATVPSLIASWKVKRIIYVSCYSVTLARDLQRFAAEGYTATSVRVFHLYPQTFHQEVVVVLDRMEKQA